MELPFPPELDRIAHDLLRLYFSPHGHAQGFPYLLTGEYGDRPEDHLHAARTAAFLAFVSLGGDPDQIPAFDFATRWEELRTASFQSLRRDLEGVGGWAHHDKLLNRHRKVPNDQHRWDMWGDPVGEWCDEPVNHVAPERLALVDLPAVAGIDPAATGLFLEAEEARVLAVLKAGLSARDYEWLFRRFYLKQSAAQLAQELPSFGASPKRALAVVDTAVHRAKRRARALLEAEGIQEHGIAA